MKICLLLCQGDLMNTFRQMAVVAVLGFIVGGAFLVQDGLLAMVLAGSIGAAIMLLIYCLCLVVASHCRLSFIVTLLDSGLDAEERRHVEVTLTNDYR
ncbi:hypothetical protein GJ700_02490 [Duganella sp. FT92W]|uniref:Uncharacterized protein n=1 Tax=Pseudoduganella rivuli TaxID=2666085 RepID=A0A7X2IIC7_9BURK|nr:hypothetical protein [Pseudoduganella rivuli]MRV70587.1 hypothetical protein [Pseudoduganella rivuli]